jgi:hypothetical protein
MKKYVIIATAEYAEIRQKKRKAGMTNNEALKPCDFCDNASYFEIVDVLLSEAVHGEWSVEVEPELWGKAVRCNSCGAQGPEKENEEEAIAAWNKRVEP